MSSVASEDSGRCQHPVVAGEHREGAGHAAAVFDNVTPGELFAALGRTSRNRLARAAAGFTGTFEICCRVVG